MAPSLGELDSLNVIPSGISSSDVVILVGNAFSDSVNRVRAYESVCGVESNADTEPTSG